MLPSPRRPAPDGTHEPARKLNTAINYARPVLNCLGLHTSWCCAGTEEEEEEEEEDGEEEEGGGRGGGLSISVRHTY